MWIKRNAPPRIPLRVKIRGTKEYAGVVELVDSVDLGSTAKSVQVRVLLPAPSPYAIIDTMVVYGDGPLLLQYTLIWVISV